MAVVLRPDELSRSAGAYGWDGGLGTSWSADPKAGLTGVLLTQRGFTSPEPPTVVRDFWHAAYAG